MVLQVKARRLKDTMNEQFSEVFQLCTFVMEHSQKPALILATLQTLHRFLTWIPLGYMFETSLIDSLVFQFFPVAMFRVVTLQCLTEIASIKLEADQYHDQLLRLFTSAMTQLTQMLPAGTNMNLAYRAGSADEQALIQALSLFLTGFLKEHGKLLEARPAMHDVLIQAHELLVMISDVDETEIFKVRAVPLMPPFPPPGLLPVYRDLQSHRI
jgi:exportin-1